MRTKPAQWMPVTNALRSAAVSIDDKLAIGAACIEEEALRRTAELVAGRDGAERWYVEHGGRFRFDDQGRLCIQVPVRPWGLAAS